MTTILFQERQFFRQWFLWVPMAVTALIFLWGLYQQLLLGEPWGDHPMSDWGLVLTSLFVFAVIALLGVMHLDTEITREEVRIIFFPMNRRTIRWEEVTAARIREYKPLTEVGGWGFRAGKNGPAFNVSGNIGLELVLRDGKKVLIGTRRPEDLGILIKTLGF